MTPRIAIVASFYPDLRGGAEVGLEALTQAFRRIGLDYLLLSLTSGGESPAGSVVGLRILPRWAWRVGLVGPPGFDRRVASAVIRQLQASPVDVVHAWDSYSAVGTVAAARTLGVPVVVSYHNNAAEPHRQVGASVLISRWLDRRERRIVSALARANAVLGISRYIAASLARAGVPRSLVHSVYLGGAVDIRASPSALRRAEIPLQMLCAGRLHEHKGFHVAIQSVKELRFRGIEVDLTIAGAGPFERDLRRLVDELELHQRVRLVGRCSTSEMDGLYDRADVVVVPTLTSEPFGRVAVEAMSRGRAVVASDSGGLRETVVEGVGYRFPPGDASALADILATVAVDTSILERLGRSAFHHCLRTFQATHVAAQVRTLYEAAVSGVTSAPEVKARC